MAPRKKGDAPAPPKAKSKKKPGAPRGNKNALGNKGGGRPSGYLPEYAEIARKISLLGATDEELAGIIGVSETTINAWKKEHIEFYEALQKGKTSADAEVAASLYRRATGYDQDAVKIFMPAGAEQPVYAPYTEHVHPDTAAAFIWLKNRRRMQWRDKQEIEHSGPNGGPIQVEPTMSPKEAAEAYANLLKDDD